MTDAGYQDDTIAAGAGTAAPRVSVIIPHLNTPDALRRCLESVAAQRIDSGAVQIIVVDNGSRLPIAPVTDAFPGVLLLVEPVPGPGPARNRGVAAAAAPIMAFIDADCRAAPGWLQAAVDAVATDPENAVIGGDIRIDFADPRALSGIEAYEAVFGFRQRMYIAQRHFSVTANLAMARRVHAIVGPFAGIDRAEDLDWGRRAHAAGFITRYVPAMRVYHPARPAFAALAAKWQRHVRHDWNAASDKPWRWRARAVALVASVPVEAVRLLASDRIAGIGNRLRGVGILTRIRWYRAAEMLRVMATPAGGAALWNREA